MRARHPRLELAAVALAIGAVVSTAAPHVIEVPATTAPASTVAH